MDTGMDIKGGDFRFFLLRHPPSGPSLDSFVQLHHTSSVATTMIYPLVNYHNYGKSPFLMGKSTINGHFQ